MGHEKAVCQPQTTETIKREGETILHRKRSIRKGVTVTSVAKKSCEKKNPQKAVRITVKKKKLVSPYRTVVIYGTVPQETKYS